MAHVQSRRKIKFILISIVVIILIIAAIFALIAHHKREVQRNASVALILSPHFGDAELALGGFLAKNQQSAVVATFFGSSTDPATMRSSSDNDLALKKLHATAQNYFYASASSSSDISSEQSDISQDISALIASYSGKNISVYGPAIFTAGIGDPDQALLYNAYMDVASDYPNKNVNFYVYEDFPYIQQFNSANVFSLEKNLENNSGNLFTSQNILLTNGDVKNAFSVLSYYQQDSIVMGIATPDLISQDKAFTQTRCGANPAEACEVVYELYRAPEATSSLDTLIRNLENNPSLSD